MSTDSPAEPNPFDGLTINFNERSLSFRGNTKKFGKVRFGTLLKLFNSVGEVCSKEFLHENNDAETMDVDSVVDLINHLKEDLKGLFGSHTHQAFIASVRGKGYTLTGVDIENPPATSGNKAANLEGEILKLTYAEHEILLRLYGDFDSVCAKNKLSDYDHDEMDSRAIDTRVYRLKKKLKDSPVEIVNIPRVGYKMQWLAGAVNMKGETPQAGEKPHFISNAHQMAEQHLKNVIEPQFQERDLALQYA